MMKIAGETLANLLPAEKKQEIENVEPTCIINVELGWLKKNWSNTVRPDELYWVVYPEAIEDDVKAYKAFIGTLSSEKIRSVINDIYDDRPFSKELLLLNVFGEQYLYE